jgi:hypothetical protein
MGPQDNLVLYPSVASVAFLQVRFTSYLGSSNGCTLATWIENASNT